MSQGKAIKERVYWHCPCELLELAKWWLPADGKTLRCPQINRCWKYFVNLWQNFPRSKRAVSDSLSDEPEHYFFLLCKIASTVRESPWQSSESQRGAGYQLPVRLKSVPKLGIVFTPLILLCTGMSFWLRWHTKKLCSSGWMPFNSVCSGPGLYSTLCYDSWEHKTASLVVRVFYKYLILKTIPFSLARVTEIVCGYLKYGLLFEKYLFWVPI